MRSSLTTVVAAELLFLNIVFDFHVLLHVIHHMSGNSLSVKRPYLGHNFLLCNTVLLAPGPVWTAPDSFYFTNTSSRIWGRCLGDQIHRNTLVFVTPVEAASRSKWWAKETRPHETLTTLANSNLLYRMKNIILTTSVYCWNKIFKLIQSTLFMHVEK